MANQEQLEILKQGVDIWNEWRKTNQNTWIDLRNAFLVGANLVIANLQGADLSHTNFTYGNLYMANLSGANLDGTDFSFANLGGADLRGASLTGVSLFHANLNQAKIDQAILAKSLIYGVSAWNLVGEFKEQRELVITHPTESQVTVDDIEVAQFVYLILNNKKIRNVINTLTSKTVLILGRFAIPERKMILNAMKEKLREFDLLPVVFDFDRPTNKDFTETIKTLAGISCFVIADVTNPKSSPLELQATIPDYQIPFAPIIQEGERPFAMMVDLQKKYDWVLKTVTYDSMETLIQVLKPLIIDPAMDKRQELRLIKAREPELISAKDFLAKGGV